MYIIGTDLETYALLYIFAVDHQASPLCIQEKFLFSEATMKIIIRRDLELFRLGQLLLAFEVLVLLSVIMYIAILRGSHLYLFQSCLTMTSIHVNYIWQIQSSKIMNRTNVKEWFVKSDFFLLIVKFLKIIMSRQLCCVVWKLFHWNFWLQTIH